MRNTKKRKDTKKRTRICKTILVIIVLGLVIPLAAADYCGYLTQWDIGETYNVSGYVNNTIGLPIEGALVINNISFQFNTTNASGYYKLELRNNTYKITATKLGYGNNYVITTVDGSDLTNQNITLFLPTLSPEIVSWYNDKTEDNSTTIYINQSEYVHFNVTANQTIDTWSWFKDGNDLNNNFDNATLVWITNGTKTLKVLGNNANGTTNIVTWTIKVGAVEEGYYLGLFLTIFGLAVCFFLYGAMDTGAWLYTNILSTFLGGTTFFITGFMSFVGVYGSEEIHQYGEVGLLFVVIGTIAVLYGILQIIRVSMNEFGVGEKEEDRDASYEYT